MAEARTGDFQLKAFAYLRINIAIIEARK